jgi:rubrerythrin
VAYAKRADQEGRPGVARLFRACAEAEQAHANRHVHAIAWTGRQARAVLEQVAVGTTEANLRTALSIESWEADHYYPALIERARSEHWPEAVRSMTFALSTERQHVQLLRAALADSAGQAAVGTFWVCPFCGRTVQARDFGHCPTCFTSARKFVQVS